MADHDENPVSIIIPAFNQLDYCRACIGALRRNTRRAHRLILVDNGSTDGVSEYFDTVPGATVIHSPENLGFAGGVNLGLKEATGHVVLLNSDTLVTEGWLTRLEHALLSSPDTGLAGPVSNNAAGPQQIEGPDFPNEQAIAAHGVERVRAFAGRVRYVTRLIGFCLMIRDKALAEIGLFDERFAIGNYEDDDYCTRARQAGYRLVIAEDSFVFHHGGKTFSAMGLKGEAFKAIMAENRRRYREKWAINLPEPESPEARAARLHERAKEAMKQGDLARATRFLRQAVETCPEVARYHNDLGAVVWEAGQYELALELFKQALVRDPDYAEALGNARDAAAFLASLGDAPTIYFLCPDYTPPAGGIRKIYRYVDILNAAGTPACVLHQASPFRCDWFDNDTMIRYMGEVTPRHHDLLVIPEIFGPHAMRLSPGVPRVILNQNAYNTFVPYPESYTGPYAHEEAKGIIVVSEDNANYLRLAFPDVPVHRIVYAIDPDRYHYDPAVKKRQLAYMPRKNREDATQVLHILRARGLDLPIVPIDGASEEDAARILRESAYFLSFGHPEGFGLPPAEAMACGCVVIGYHGNGGREFLRPPYAHPVETGDIVAYVCAVEQVLRQDPAGQAQRAADYIHQHYTVEKERESVLRIFQGVLA